MRQFDKFKILELRRREDMSLADFARAARTSRQAVKMWEDGNTVPTVPILIRIADAFEVDLNFFITDVRQSDTNKNVSSNMS